MDGLAAGLTGFRKRSILKSLVWDFMAGGCCSETVTGSIGCCCGAEGMLYFGVSGVVAVLYSIHCYGN